MMGVQLATSMMGVQLFQGPAQALFMMGDGMDAPHSSPASKALKF
tara:strand:- start:460 stop:594 length:135 start_codon:yes stop_codon:yes gene_type:complete